MSAQRRPLSLVFARVGDRSLHKSWLTPRAQRTWDVQLSSFGADLDRVQDGDLPLSIDHGTKWDSIVRYFEANPQTIDAYDYFLFPDDDLLFPENGMDRLFEICAKYDLDVAQPALDRESYLSYPITCACGGFDLRFTNYVETMTPCFSRRQMKLVLPLLHKFPTGWGADIAWAMLSDQPAFKAAIIDAVPITHTRPQFGGDIYKTYSKHGMDPRADLAAVQTSYANLPGKMLVYGAVAHGGRKLNAFEAQIRNGLTLLSQAHASRAPKMLRRTGMGMCLRSVTQARYRPEHLHPVDSAAVSA